ncbi:beta strand repeat-containing protein [Zavarzinia sp. CC-PAN008]|uniref:beta strand repeat-containing protein n=1 Tax=Zavarzinia sp. CC-PAN008 TaxID=3243332 RepID=UPI003F7424DA
MATFRGTTGQDRFFGGSADDTFFFGDVFRNLVQNDLSSADTVNGGAGNDTLAFTLTMSVSEADLANVRNIERIVLSSDIGPQGSGPTTNTVFLTDAMVGSAQSDVVTIVGTTINDRITAASVTGAAHRTIFMAGGGNDTAIGGAGKDTFMGGDDNDILSGGANNDTLMGGNGLDTLIAGLGDDFLDGGAGADLFQLTAEQLTSADSVIGGNDAVLDTLELTTAGTVTAAELAGVSGVEVIRFGVAGLNNIALSDAFVGSAIGDKVTILGSAGADSISAVAVAGAANRINAVLYAGADRMTGGAGADTIDGGTGDDVLSGAAGNDTLIGGDGLDTLTAGIGADILDGGAGNDSFRFGVAELTSADTVNGGTGRDVLTFTSSGVIAASSLDKVSLVEVIQLANGANRLTLSNTAVDAVASGTAADLLSVIGGSGLDIIDASGIATTGADGRRNLVQLFGAAGNDTLLGGAGENYLSGDAGDDLLSGLAGDDSLLGGVGNDTLLAGTGNDKVFGGDGNDTFRMAEAELGGVTGNRDSLLGGLGIDTLQFTTAGTIAGSDLSGVEQIEVIRLASGNNTVALLERNATSATGGVITVVGNAGTDVLDASSVDTGGVHLLGAAGNDTLIGGGGRNVLDGGEGNDVLVAGSGTNTLIGGNGNDTFRFEDPFTSASIIGGAGADTLVVGGGFGAWTLPTSATSLISGVEVIRLETSSSAAGNADTIDIADSTVASAGNRLLVIGDGSANILNASAVAAGRSVTLVGNGGADQLSGGQGADRLEGGDGNDVLKGNGGADVIVGGTGNDTITGGTGADTIVWNQLTEGIDTIVGFSHADDSLRFNKLVFGFNGSSFDTRQVDSTGSGPIGAADLVLLSGVVINNASQFNEYLDSNGTGAGGAGLFVAAKNSAGATLLFYTGDASGAANDGIQIANFGNIALSSLDVNDFVFV